ncbi:MFS transporter, partial [Paracoccus sp. PXZ]
PRAQRAKGVTQVMLGLTVANIAGVPLAGMLGQGLGWRWGFALPGVLALLAGMLILRLAARVGAPKDARPLTELKALRNPAVMLTLLVGSIGFGGLFAVYSYLSAAMLATTQPPGWAIPATLSAFGIGGMLTLLVGSIGFGGLFAVYSYLSAAMLATTQPPGWAIPATLSAFGIGGTLGSMLAARLTIRHGTWGAALRLMLFMAATQAFAAWAVGNWGM